MIRTTLLILSAFLLVLSIPNASMAKGDVKVGDTIPHDLSLKDQNGKMRSFSDLTGKKGLVLVFVRSAEWCPFCQKQLIDLDKNRKKFTDEGYNIVSVSYDPVEQLEKFTTKNKPEITLLSDPGSKSIRAFGILNEASAKGTFSYGIPHPGVYIVSKDKKVQAKFFEGDYKQRPSVKELMDEIKKLNKPPEPVYESLDNMGADPIIPGEDVIDIPEKITEPVTLPEATDTPPIEAPAADMPAIEEPVMDEAVDMMPSDPLAMPEEPVMPEAATDPAMPEVTPTRAEPDTSVPVM